jgi:predicted aconitase/predicted aconitase with swiveling domain
MSLCIVPANVSGDVVFCEQGLSFWGGVAPMSGEVIDAHHPLHGQCLAGKIVLMPTSRGSCSGSGVLLELALNGCAPAALVFSEAEEILTLGAKIASRLFDRHVSVLRLEAGAFETLAQAKEATIRDNVLAAEGLRLDLRPVSEAALDLSPYDVSCLSDDPGDPQCLAMEVICSIAVAQGAKRLVDVSRGHIDGCIYAHEANLIFAERLRDMGARTRIPTTINAISVDRENWQTQGMAADFGNSASRLADAYVAMGAQPTFTCAPYLLDDVPQLGEDIGWSESNAVIYANSVLGARTAKLPDYLDLFVAMTGRAPEAGVYLAENRRPACVIECDVPYDADDSLWPLLGWLAGQLAPDRVPVLTGVSHLHPQEDDLRAICAAFGTTSASPLLHVHGVTPEADLDPLPNARRASITTQDLAKAWQSLNSGSNSVDLVAIGSPHASLREIAQVSDLLGGRARHPGTDVIITVGRGVMQKAEGAGYLARLDASGVTVVPDICWCSITEPVFPSSARTLMTNSGKYAHYAPGLSGRSVRFGGLNDCVTAALTGQAPGLPDWLLPKN